MALVAQDQLADVVVDLHSHDVQKQHDALLAVARAGDAGSAHYGTVLELARSSGSLFVKRAAYEAVAVAPEGRATEALDVLEDGLSSNDAGVRAAAARGLGRLGPEGSVAKLGGLAADDHVLVRSAALGALAAAGPKASSEAKAVAANLRAPLLRADALRALGKLGGEGAAYVEDMAVFLEDSDGNIRLAVCEALRDMESIPESVVAKAGELLNHQCDRFRATAALAIGSCKTAQAEEYVATLTKMLRENTQTHSQALLAPNCAAAISLGRLGVKTDLLASYLQSKNPNMRAAACQGLSELGRTGLTHATALAGRLEDEHDGVRLAALRALEKLQEVGSLDSSVTTAMKRMADSM
mmetsp:Transcript_114101/g.317629  ORF Transcript_114101/g.317629 Transcript_114101/m.317629 type:complete len:355 (-) Transcript_114101:79-1143(-)